MRNDNKSTGVFVFGLVLAIIIVFAILALMFVCSVNGGMFVYDKFGVGGLTYSSILLAAALGIGINLENTRKK